jgi:membrane-bound serine protease (ClpP class)
MTPDTNIGAATPVIPSADGMMPTGEKEVSFMRAKMRALAERNHHNPALGEAMVDKDIELRSYTDAGGKLQVFAVYSSKTTPQPSSTKPFDTGDAVRIVKKILDENPLPNANPPAKPPEPEAAPAVVSPEKTPSPVPIENTQLVLPAGKLLTLTPSEAIAYGLIPTTANSLTEVLSYYNYFDAEVRRIAPNWAEVIFRWLSNPMVSGLLLMFGIGGLYLEMKTPGAILPAIVGVVCLSLFFGSHLVLGVAEWLDVLLVVAGIALILLEIFVFPGLGVLGVAGILLLIVGLYLTLAGVMIPRYSWDYERLRNAGLSLTIAASSLAVFVFAMWKLFPHTPLYGRFVQLHVQQPAQGYVVQTAAQHDAAIGLEGVATSMLRPAGRGQFGDATYRVVSQGEYIPPGTPIVIVQVDGNRYVVEKREGAA